MCHLATLLVLVSVVSAPAPFIRPSRQPDDDLKRMQGVWVCVSNIVNGKPFNLRAHPITATIKDDRMGFGTPSDIWTMRLDVAKRPGHIDLWREKGPIQFTGVYELKGDTLIICWRYGTNRTRPSGFSAKQPDVWLRVYQRRRP
jgi:uncharacterized protein (TIGR03067 family)